MTDLDPSATVQAVAGQVRDALTQLGHAWECKDGTTVEVAFSALALLPSAQLGPVALLEVDTQRLPRRVSVGDLTHERTLHHLTAVTGHPVRVLNTTGLTYAVLLQPQPRRRLPAGVALADAGDPPPGPYQVPVGLAENGPLWRSLPDLDVVLVAGTRGMGKSTWINVALAWLLATNGPEALRVAIIDPKEVELATWAGAPHLLGPVATDAAEAEVLLGRVLGELDARRSLFARAGARNLADYNAKTGEALPLVLVVADELGDLAHAAGGAKSGALATLARLIAKGRAFGVHAILATQRPDSDAVAGILKANIATRLAFWLPDAANYRIALNPPAGQRLPHVARTPGRMLARLADGYQVLQAFHLPDADLERIAAEVAGGHRASIAPAPLGQAEIDLVRWALAENGGHLTAANIRAALGLSEWRAASLARDWQTRGWLEKDPLAANARRVTAELAELADRFEAGFEARPAV